MNDEAIQKIISYANEYLFEPRSNWSKQAIMNAHMKDGQLMRFF